MSYLITSAAIADVLILEPQVFGEPGDFFFESFNVRDFSQATGLNVSFVQDNHQGQHRQIDHRVVPTQVPSPDFHF